MPESASSSAFTLAHKAAVQRALLDWYTSTRRSLPWRETTSPYRTWVSEVMLQQTRVATVVDYFERWMRCFPNVRSLAEADTEAVLRAWEGLGYYSRARNLQRAARLIVELPRGELPADAQELRKLPGIGRYTAGAIASIAFGLPEPALDGNLMRVLTRLLSLRGDPRRPPLHESLWELARQWIPTDRAGDFNQALMDLGATLCTPTPRCDACPLRASCQARRLGLTDVLPETAPRPAITHQKRSVALIERRGCWLLVRAPNTVRRWAGLWQFPSAMVEPGAIDTEVLLQAVSELGLTATAVERFAQLTHAVTRFRIELTAYRLSPPRGRLAPGPYAEAAWVRIPEVGERPMPAPHRRLARAWQTAEADRPSLRA